MSKQKLKSLLDEGKVTDVRGESDTIKLWESYRQQALLWRAIALLQIPATALACLLAVIMWSTRSIILKVPQNPKPGTYAAQDIPNSEFINFAQEYVNLLASYTHPVARRQFEAAALMITEPYLSKFREEILVSELKVIETTSRTQFFFADPAKTTIERDGRTLRVTFSGDRLKIVAGQELPLVKTKFSVQLTTIPRNPVNPYGIAITDFAAEEVR
jgi:hypothetical protein